MQVQEDLCFPESVMSVNTIAASSPQSGDDVVIISSDQEEGVAVFDQTGRSRKKSLDKLQGIRQWNLYKWSLFFNHLGIFKMVILFYRPRKVKR